MAHDHGMRYKLYKMVTNQKSKWKDWDLGGSWFLHKTKGVWEFMSAEVIRQAQEGADRRAASGRFSHASGLPMCW